MTANLDKFSEIAMDFKNVDCVGQGFADEVFRVFARRHPVIVIRTVNASSAVEAMLNHARTGEKASAEPDKSQPL